MVLVSHRYKFIYIKNKKVAGTSVEAFFEKYCVGEKKEKSYVIQHSSKPKCTMSGIIGNREFTPNKSLIYYNHMTAVELKRALGETIFGDYYKFCVVRNPYDVLVSGYYYSKTTDSFAEFIEKRVERSNYERYSIDDAPICDFYIRYENLLEDVEAVCKKLGVEFDLSQMPNFKGDYRHNKDYRSMYDEYTRKKVEESCKKER